MKAFLADVLLAIVIGLVLAIVLAEWTVEDELLHTNSTTTGSNP